MRLFEAHATTRQPTPMLDEAESVAIDERETVTDWAKYYREQFHLPADERGGYVMLSVTNRIGIVHAPEPLAARVQELLRRQGSHVPLLARPTRLTFIAAVDYSPGNQVLELLARIGVCIPVVGSALMIPTSLGRWTRENAFWVDPPKRDCLLPLLSTVLTTALAAAPDRSAH